MYCLLLCMSVILYVLSCVFYSLMLLRRNKRWMNEFRIDVSVRFSPEDQGWQFLLVSQGRKVSRYFLFDQVAVIISGRGCRLCWLHGCQHLQFPVERSNSDRIISSGRLNEWMSVPWVNVVSVCPLRHMLLQTFCVSITRLSRYFARFVSLVLLSLAQRKNVARSRWPRVSLATDVDTDVG